jgi:O-antigen/teichoic acid export membrane protein
MFRHDPITRHQPIRDPRRWATSLYWDKLSPRFAGWLVVCARFASVQVVVQILSFASGILLVRWLDKPQYALFTIFGMIQGTMNVLADNGVNIALLAEGGRLCHDRTAFGRLINSALPIRRILGAIALVIMLPIGYRLMRESGASVSISIALLLFLAATLHFSLVTGVLGVVPRLLRQFSRLQNLDLISAAGRLALLGLMAWFLVLNVVTAATVAALAAVAQYFVLRHWTALDVDVHAPASLADRTAILGVVKRLTPNTLFYCVQGQLTLWLISLFATGDKVAEVGALGRLAMIFAVFSSVLSGIITPAFARCQDRARLLNAYFSVVGSFACLCGAALILAVLFPQQLLWVLGKGYEHLHEELLLMVAATLLSAITTTMFSLNAARAWIDVAWLEIPLRILLQIALLFSFDISTVQGVLWVALLSNLSPLLINIVLTYRGFRSLQSSQ